VTALGRFSPSEVDVLRAFIVLATGAFLANATFCQAADLRTTSTIAGVSIGASEADIKAVLGSPTEIRNTGDALDPEWHFDTKVVVSFWDRGDRVAEIRATDPTICTDTGVCSGMSLREIQSLIGEPVGAGKLAEGSNHYPTTYDTCWLDVSIHADRVVSIAIRCQP
jgi:hypothetical protein